MKTRLRTSSRLTSESLFEKSKTRVASLRFCVRVQCCLGRIVVQCSKRMRIVERSSGCLVFITRGPGRKSDVDTRGCHKLDLSVVCRRSEDSAAITQETFILSKCVDGDECL